MSNGDRKRRKWGCVVACKDADGSIVSWCTQNHALHILSRVFN